MVRRVRGTCFRSAWTKQPAILGERRQRLPQSLQRRIGIAGEAGEQAETGAARDHLLQDPVIAGPPGRGRCRQVLGHPAGHREILMRSVEPDPQRRIGRDEPRPGMRIEKGAGTIDAISHRLQLARDQFADGRQGRHDRKIRIPARAIDRHVGMGQLERDVRQCHRKLAPAGRQKPHIPIIGDDADRAAIRLGIFGSPADRVCDPLHVLRQGNEIASLGRQGIAVRQPVEQPEAKRLFERMDAPPDRGDGEPLAPRRRGQAASLGNRQE